MNANAEPTTERATFGAAIRSARLDAAVSQEALGAQLGSSQASVASWERGTYIPDPEVVFRLERKLGVRPGALSQHLGYLPIEAAGGTLVPTVDVAEAILKDTHLGEAEKRGLIAAYRAMRR
jgi:transcriptional regulator with XRE-family HTH domain